MKKIFFSYCQKDEKSLEFIDKFIEKTNYDENDYFLDRKKILQEIITDKTFIKQ